MSNRGGCLVKTLFIMIYLQQEIPLIDTLYVDCGSIFVLQLQLCFIDTFRTFYGKKFQTFFLQIWLTDICANLQHKLKNVPEKDPVFDGKPQGSLTGKYTLLQLWLVVKWMRHLKKTLTIFLTPIINFREKMLLKFKRFLPSPFKVVDNFANFVYYSLKSSQGKGYE